MLGGRGLVAAVGSDQSEADARPEVSLERSCGRGERSVPLGLRDVVALLAGHAPNQRDERRDSALVPETPRATASRVEQALEIGGAARHVADLRLDERTDGEVSRLTRLQGEAVVAELARRLPVSLEHCADGAHDVGRS